MIGARCFNVGGPSVAFWAFPVPPFLVFLLLSLFFFPSRLAIIFLVFFFSCLGSEPSRLFLRATRVFLLPHRHYHSGAPRGESVSDSEAVARKISRERINWCFRSSGKDDKTKAGQAKGVRCGGLHAFQQEETLSISRGVVGPRSSSKRAWGRGGRVPGLEAGASPRPKLRSIQPLAWLWMPGARQGLRS